MGAKNFTSMIIWDLTKRHAINIKKYWQYFVFEKQTESITCVLLWPESNQNCGSINHATVVERVNKDKNPIRFI